MAHAPGHIDTAPPGATSSANAGRPKESTDTVKRPNLVTVKGSDRKIEPGTYAATSGSGNIKVLEDGTVVNILRPIRRADVEAPEWLDTISRFTGMTVGTIKATQPLSRAEAQEILRGVESGGGRETAALLKARPELKANIEIRQAQTVKDLRDKGIIDKQDRIDVARALREDVPESTLRDVGVSKSQLRAGKQVVRRQEQEERLRKSPKPFKQPGTSRAAVVDEGDEARVRPGGNVEQVRLRRERATIDRTITLLGDAKVNGGYDLTKAIELNLVPERDLITTFGAGPVRDAKTALANYERAKRSAEREAIRVGAAQAKAEAETARLLEQAAENAGFFSAEFAKKVGKALQRRVTPDFTEGPRAAFFTMADVRKIQQLRSEGKKAEADRLLATISERRPSVSNKQLASTVLDLVPFAEQRHSDLTPAERTASAIIDVIILLPILPKGVKASVKGGKVVLTKAGKAVRLTPQQKAFLASERGSLSLGKAKTITKPRVDPDFAKVIEEVNKANRREAFRIIEKAGKKKPKKTLAERLAAAKAKQKPPGKPPKPPKGRVRTTKDILREMRARQRKVSPTRSVLGAEIAAAVGAKAAAAPVPVPDTRKGDQPTTRQQVKTRVVTLDRVVADPQRKPTPSGQTFPRPSTRATPVTRAQPRPLPEPITKTGGGPTPSISTPTATTTGRGGNGGGGGGDDGGKPTPPTRDGSRQSGRRRPTATTRFTLPDGKVMAQGRYPKVVEYLQGPFKHRIDLQTGSRRVSRSEVSGSPEATFRVIETSQRPPKRRRYDQGVVDLVVDGDSVDFVRDRRLNDRSVRSRNPLRTRLRPRR